MLKLMLITNDVQFAKEAEKAGVDRIFVDLEVNGKQARQGHLDTFITSHTIADVAKMRSALNKAELLVRLNPLYDGTQEEIDSAIDSGADLLMLPMFHKAEELATFSKLVRGRAGIVPLIETKSAMNDLERIMNVDGLDEVFVGLNDLHLDMGLDFMFELLSNGVIEKYARTASGRGMEFGFGGIARLDEGLVTGQAVLSEHVRLGSGSVILSRTFCRAENGSTQMDYRDFSESVARLRKVEKVLQQRSEIDENRDHAALVEAIERVVQNKRGL